MSEPILSVRNLKKHYPVKRGLFNREVGRVRAVDGISFDIKRGETLGIVGESGCGKSTAAASIVRLEDPTSGAVIFRGGGRTEESPAGTTRPTNVVEFGGRELKRFRREAQMIFQDPASSFNPRKQVGESVAELLEVHGMTDRKQRRAIVEDLLERVGLAASDYERYPHEFSGGQKQRIAIARALVLNPELVIADEPVSALDVSIQAEILSLLSDLQEEFDLSILFISHNMSVVKHICDRVAVMYLGKIVEIGPTERLFTDPRHPYTEALVSAIPTPDPRRRRRNITLEGTVPSPADPPSGCRFHTRCHRIIQPAGVSLPQDGWRRVMHFREHVSRGAIDIDGIKENTVADGSEATPAHLEAQVREEYGLTEPLPDERADEALDRAMEALVRGKTDEARSVLEDRFTTPCEETEPGFTEHDDDHRSACLLHSEEYDTRDVESDAYRTGDGSDTGGEDIKTDTRD
ncbi:ABC transporter ATP-binding protein [Halorubrum vacuolatum]|uniref:Peptide/nickel transport system ATP-binding protein n=1 Tax=Halorubrum vacuolatum TaxID=63740 RepID=A0A238VAZ4_HALVU|nr:oligopeptide/dipeptide ABC transporter ATP-binding protein [Halorubrum vacuolatum]SNR31368.1 peptide/nickel transport system ATP-binding protein [Halorubrum vacuolatum]